MLFFLLAPVLTLVQVNVDGVGVVFLNLEVVGSKNVVFCSHSQSVPANVCLYFALWGISTVGRRTLLAVYVAGGLTRGMTAYY